MVKIGSRAPFSRIFAVIRFFGDYSKSIHPTMPIECSLERSRYYGHFEPKNPDGQININYVMSNTNSGINMK